MPDRSPFFAALGGTTVIDISQGISGPYTSMLLRQAGARVIKIEPPEGDYARRLGPPAGGEGSAVFAALNRGKESVALDLGSDVARFTVRRLLMSADVFLEDVGTDRLAAWGLTSDQLEGANPRLIRATITPYGEHGLLAGRPASELTIQAAADYTHSLGSLSEPPRRVGADIAYINSAIFLYQATLAALFQRSRTGTGQHVSVSMLSSLLYTRKTVWAAMGNPDQWTGAHTETYTTPATYGYRTRDGSIYFSLRRGSEEQYFGLLEALGILEDALADPRFEDGGRSAVGIGPAAQAVKHLWERGLKQLSTEEALALLHQYGAEGVPVNDYEAVLASPQVKALELIHAVPDPVHGASSSLRLPWRVDDQLPTLDVPAPVLGQHTASVLREAD